MKKATDKEKFQSKISKSYKDMLSALKENYGNKQENTILDRVGKKLREIKNG
jgi:predicted ArsR family transcriptional regulator